MALNIIHRPEEKRFEYRSGNDLAVCEYERAGDIWNFHHTLVPRTMRGQGLAGQLVETALRHVAEHKGKVVAQCSYVADYIQKHPEFKDLLETL